MVTEGTMNLLISSLPTLPIFQSFEGLVGGVGAVFATKWVDGSCDTKKD